MTYSIASESLGGGVCFQACLLVCKGLAPPNSRSSFEVCAIFWDNKIEDIFVCAVDADC